MQFLPGCEKLFRFLCIELGHPCYTYMEHSPGTGYFGRASYIMKRPTKGLPAYRMCNSEWACDHKRWIILGARDLSALGLHTKDAGLGPPDKDGARNNACGRTGPIPTVIGKGSSHGGDKKTNQRRQIGESGRTGLKGAARTTLYVSVYGETRWPVANPTHEYSTPDAPSPSLCCHVGV